MATHKGTLTAEERAFYSSETAEENRQQIRIDPNRPGYIRADEDDGADEFEEDIGLSKAGVKRKHVRTDVDYTIVSKLMHQQGYDSDSSQEGASKKKKSKTSGKQKPDDDDMFDENPPASEDQPKKEEQFPEEDEYGKLKPKKIQFVDIEHIDGQEFSDEDKDVEDEEEFFPSTPDDSEDEGLDDEVGLAGSKKHAPKIEKFNLKQEQQEGAFTSDGGYIRKAADPRAHQDVWLEGLTKGSVERTARAMEKRREREREVERRQREDDSAFSPVQRLEILIRALKPRETPFDALARLNQGKKKKWQPSQKWKKSKMAVDEPATEEQQEQDPTKLKEQIEMITSAADKLLSRGTMNIYSIARERLIILLQEETGERFRENGPAGADVKWEYKWPGTEEVYSDFTSGNMRGWNMDGFFGDGVLVRRAGSQEEWKNNTEVEF
jgi:CD2 antigen cytoplasmic tail-binding protein 2